MCVDLERTYPGDRSRKGDGPALPACPGPRRRCGTNVTLMSRCRRRWDREHGREHERGRERGHDERGHDERGHD